MQGESPLVNPCNCSGGIKYIHLACLHRWLKTNEILRSSTNEHCMIHTYKKIACELCKEVFPDIIQNGDSYYALWNFIEPPYKSYIILETSLPTAIPENHSCYKTIFIINFDTKNSITIGRSKSSDLRIKDVSVSRMHSELILTEHNTVTIQDLNSKFGTIVLLQNRKMPIYTVPLTIQIGNYLISMWMKPSFSLLKCISCGSHSNFKAVNYNRLNSQQISLSKSFTIKKWNRFNDADQKCSMATQENESMNNANKNNNDDNDNDTGSHSHSHSSIEEDVENGHINNNSFRVRNRNERYLDAQMSLKSDKTSGKSKRFPIPLVSSFPQSLKKYERDRESNNNYSKQRTKENFIKLLRLKSKNKFLEDQQGV